jgi:uncharacterized cupin superfamily protein
MRPALHEASAHRTVALYGVEFAYRLEGANTDVDAAVLEVTIPPRTLVKPHQHSKEDEFSLILSGRVGARIGDAIYEEIDAGASIVRGAGPDPARARSGVDGALLRAGHAVGLTILDDWSRDLQARDGITL